LLGKHDAQTEPVRGGDGEFTAALHAWTVGDRADEHRLHVDAK
jgi:hypothetical protein